MQNTPIPIPVKARSARTDNPGNRGEGLPGGWSSGVKFPPTPVDPSDRSVELDAAVEPASSRLPIAINRMNSLLDFFHRIRDVRQLVAWGGYAGMTLIVFAETGLLIGFFLPGDSLIVTAGLLAATTGVVNVYMLGALLTVASILGNTVGYAIGAASGPRLFNREDSVLFNKKHLYRAHAFYEKHGGRTIILARFMPIVRTFVPVIAGIGRMGYARYTQFNVIGGAAWIWSMLFIGYFLGRYIPGVDQHIEIVIVVVIFLSLLPGIISWWRHRGTPPTESDVVSK
jgi:membrane-associated protein